jgi:hypothetical protein
MPSTLAEAIDIALKADNTFMHLQRLQQPDRPNRLDRQGPVPMEVNAVMVSDDDDANNSTSDDSNYNDSDSDTPAAPARINALGSRPVSTAAKPKATEPPDRAKLRAQGRCYKCQQTGHVYKDCPLRRKQHRASKN